jgi:hypothetical protein
MSILVFWVITPLQVHYIIPFKKYLNKNATAILQIKEP